MDRRCARQRRSTPFLWLVLVEKLLVSFNAIRLQQDRNMRRVPDKAVRQNGILIRICELPGQRLLAVKMRRAVDIAKVEQQDADMFGRAEKSCLIEFKVSLICAISLQM